MGAKVKVIKRKGDSLYEKLYLVEVFKGMWVTLGHFIRNLLDNSKLYVRHYPEQEPEITPRCRWTNWLLIWNDDCKSSRAFVNALQIINAIVQNQNYFPSNQWNNNFTISAVSAGTPCNIFRRNLDDPALSVSGRDSSADGWADAIPRRMQVLGTNMPVDGKRMIFGGFDVLFDTASS